MQDPTPKYLQWIIQKLRFIAIPNLGVLIAGLAILGFIGVEILHTPMDRFVFDPELVREGEWHRLFSFPIIQNPIFLFFFALVVYYTVGTLEASWGLPQTTFYVLMSYFCAMGASFLSDVRLNLWQQVMENLMLAFGTLFPNIEFYLFFIIPVKAKWLAAFAGLLVLFQFFTGSNDVKIFLVICYLPYLLFFGPYLYRTIYYAIRKRNNPFN